MLITKRAHMGEKNINPTDSEWWVIRGKIVGKTGKGGINYFGYLL